MSAPTYERQQAIMALLAETALASANGNGSQPASDVVWVLSSLALRAPDTARRCPRLLSVLPGDVRAAVQGTSGAPAVAGETSGRAALAGWLTVAEAAELAGLTTHSMRERCRREQVTALKHRVTGEWRIDPASIERRAHGEART